MKEIVKFPVNTPVEVTLECETGIHVNDRYGDQVMYSLTDDRVMYVPPYVEQRFQELAVGAGEPLVLCKRQTDEGSRNRTEWSVKRAPQQPDPSLVGTAAANCGPLSDIAVEDNANHCTRELFEQTENTDGPGKEEEQPSGNSTAPKVQQSLDHSVRKHQPQHIAQGAGNDIVLAATTSRVPTLFSTEDNVYLPAMSMEVALARRSAIIEFTRRIMIKDQDFGEIPGTSKPTLLKPGAEKLCNFFGLEPELTPVVEEIDWTGSQHGGEIFCYARYRCRLLRKGRVVGAGEGSCNSWEAKYRHRWVTEEQLPESLDRSQIQKREGRRTLCEFEFAIDRAETTGVYGKPAEHWQRFRGRDPQRDRTTGRETDATRHVGGLGTGCGYNALPGFESGCRGSGEHDSENGPEARPYRRHSDRCECFRILHPGRGGFRPFGAEYRYPC
jgi:hypothetical protein